MVLSYVQWKDKHANSAKYAALSKAQKKQRYNDYLQSVSKSGTFSGSNQGHSSGSSGTKGGSTPARTSVTAQGRVAKLRASPPVIKNPRTHDFLTARTNPWCPRVRNVGYPVNVPGGSLKWFARARGTLTCNAAGYGFILVSPGYSGWSDNLAVSYSSGPTYAGAADAFPANFSPVGSTQVGMKGGPMTFAAANLVNDDDGATFVRLNALGVRIRQDVALLRKAGSVKTICLPMRGADLLAFTGAQILAMPLVSKWFQANEADTPWYSALWSPSFPEGVYPSSALYDNYDHYQCEGGLMSIAAIEQGFESSPVLGILVSGSPGGVWDFDVAGWYEMFGNIVQGTTYTTTTYADPVGMAAVTQATTMTAVNAMEQTTEGAASASNVMSGVWQAAQSLAGNDTVKQFVTDALGSFSGSAPITSTAQPIVAPALEGAVADMNISGGDSVVESLAARLASLQMPEIPSASSASVGDALAALGELAI